MDAVALGRFVTGLRAHGAVLVVQDGTLYLDGRRSSDLPEVTVATIRAHRAQLIELLTPHRCADCGVNAGSGVRCSDCAAARVHPEDR